MFGEQKKLRPAKIGYIRLQSIFSGESINSPAGNEIEKGIIGILKDNGSEVVKAQKTVNYFDNAIEVARHMNTEDVDGVVVFVSSWIEATTGHTLVKELKGIPVLFWSYALWKVGDTVEGSGSFTGFSVLKGALDRIGVKFSFIVGDCKKTGNKEELAAFVNTARAMKKMDRARIGLIGSFGIGMYSATIDHLITKQKIGPEIIPISELEFMGLVNNVKKENIEKLKKHLAENTVIDQRVSDELLEQTVRFYFALDTLVEKYKLDVINPRCHLELSVNCMACIPLGLLSDRKIVTGCESDILISISMLLHYYLSDEVVTYFDIFDFDDDTIYFSNCGFSPLSFVPGKPKLNFCDPKAWGFQGITNANLMRDGKVDCFRMFEKINSFGLLYTRASTVDAPVRAYVFPTMKVKIKNVKDFIKFAPSQHISVAYSNIGKEIALYCRFKDVELYAV